MKMTGHVNSVLVYVLLWYFVLTSAKTSAQGQVSGNAIDLANMNMNMMHMKCPLEPCQSVCLKKQPETGCFICDPKCNTGSSIGMPDSRLPMNVQPMNSGQSSFYNGCQHDNWMQCPMSCQRNFDQSGCFKCLCLDSNTLQAGQSSTPTVVSMVTSGTPDQHLNTENKSTFSTVNNTSTSKTLMQVTTKAPTLQTKEHSTTTRVALETSTGHLTTTSKLFQNDIHLQRQDFNRHGPLQTTAYHNNNNNKSLTTNPTPNVKSLQNQNTKLSSINEFKPNNLTFVLFGIMIVLITLCLVFFIAWRKSSRKLKKNKDELYFVHKAYRQDSNARLSSNDMLDPVYADISPRPDPPPRSPNIDRASATSNGLFTTNDNVTNDGPVRSFSQNSDTPLKGHFEDCKHDYLELI